MGSAEREIQVYCISQRQKLHCSLSRPKNEETLHVEVDVTA